MTGNTAVVGFRIDEATGVDQGFMTGVRDNGPSSASQPVDELFFFAFLDAPPTECPGPNGPFPEGLPIQDPPSLIFGDIVVVDAQPLPTAKEQCKNGGWRDFPGFENQGQCVAFVQRGPKP